MIRSFSKLIFEGKIHSAIRYLSDNTEGGVLNIYSPADDRPDHTVLEVLREKHPPTHNATPESLVNAIDDPPDFHPVFFRTIDRSCYSLGRAAHSGQGRSVRNRCDKLAENVYVIPPRLFKPLLSNS